MAFDGHLYFDDSRAVQCLEVQHSSNMKFGVSLSKCMEPYVALFEKYFLIKILNKLFLTVDTCPRHKSYTRLARHRHNQLFSLVEVLCPFHVLHDHFLDLFHLLHDQMVDLGSVLVAVDDASHDYPVDHCNLRVDPVDHNLVEVLDFGVDHADRTDVLIEFPISTICHEICREISISTFSLSVTLIVTLGHHLGESVLVSIHAGKGHSPRVV